MSESDSLAEQAKKQAAIAAVGAGFGAVTQQVVASSGGARPTPIAAQVGSAMGAAAVGGAGIGGTLAAGGAVVTAKVSAGVAMAVAAAPMVLTAAAVGAVGYGLYRWFRPAPVADPGAAGTGTASSDPSPESGVKPDSQPG